MKLVEQPHASSGEGGASADAILSVARLAGQGNRNARSPLVDAVSPAMLRAIREVMGHRAASALGALFGPVPDVQPEDDQMPDALFAQENALLRTGKAGGLGQLGQSGQQSQTGAELARRFPRSPYHPAAPRRSKEVSP